MKTTLTLVCALVALFAAWPADAAARAAGNDDRVCFYEGPNYRGWEQCFTPGSNVNLGNRRNNISSIRIYGSAIVDIYDSNGWVALQFNTNVSDLRRIVSSTRSFNGRINNVRVRWPDADRAPARGRQVRDGICVYEHAGYSGRVDCFEAGDNIRDVVRRYGRNDEISSIRVFGRAAVVLYQDIHFGGAQLIVDRDIPDLARVRMHGFSNWNDQVSSMQVEAWSAARNRPRGW
jgi:hypothetical protein